MTDPNRFSDKVALVTGGAGAFGRAIAFRFVEEGARVVIGDIDLDAAALVASELGDSAAPMRLDVTSSAASEEAVAFAERQFGGLDVLVNNAGLTHRETRLEDFTDESFEAAYNLIFDVNVKGTMYCSRYAIPAMRRRGGGAIVNTASIAAVAHRPGVTVYSSAKAAVVVFTRNLALELAPDIRVNAVLPVAADTPFMEAAFGEPLPPEAAERMRAGLPMNRLCEPSDVADAVAFLAGDDAAMITGTALPVDGGRSLG
jgi:3-oxoacyl-[acyl-carrier protein] reductase